MKIQMDLCWRIGNGTKSCVSRGVIAAVILCGALDAAVSGTQWRTVKGEGPMTTTTDQPDLATRVQQFVCMELPGQPRGMHMGTSYLVNDLWSEIQRLRAIEDTAIDLIENIREHGMHDNWKRLAAALEK
jgi:hypothetical protein